MKRVSIEEGGREGSYGDGSQPQIYELSEAGSLAKQNANEESNDSDAHSCLDVYELE